MNGFSATLPTEVAAEIGVDESIRGLAENVAIVVSVIGTSVEVGTFLVERESLKRLAVAIRRWVTRRPAGDPPTVLKVRGKEFKAEIQLPPNVSSERILEALTALADEAEADVASR